MKPLISLRKAMELDGLLGRAVRGNSWAAWRVVMLAAMGEELSRGELALFTRLTGRPKSPTRPVQEMAAIVGRRGGKTRALSTIAVYIAALCDHSPVLAYGERGLVLLIAPNQKQSRVALDYCAGIIEQSVELKPCVVKRTTDSISLSNGIDIEVRAANFRQLRSVTCVAVLADETAFFNDDGSGSANPDTEILNAVRPSLATTKGPLLIASSPYRKSGVLWDIYRSNFGANSDPSLLVLKGSSRDFNPSLDQKVIDRAMASDPARARAEWLGEFRDDIESYILREVVEACVDTGVRERVPSSKFDYFAFTDPAGGSGQDAMTLAIAHHENEMAVIDAVREIRPPFSPTAAIAEFCDLLRRYKIRDLYT
ncbi:MAG: hypothetical protein J0I29_12400 [Rhizobiales bacterium]|nr:hypothetical protein [Hyphomicrobiales bacterium]